MIENEWLVKYWKKRWSKPVTPEQIFKQWMLEKEWKGFKNSIEYLTLIDWMKNQVIPLQYLWTFNGMTGQQIKVLVRKFFEDGDSEALTAFLLSSDKRLVRAVFDWSINSKKAKKELMEGL